MMKPRWYRKIATCLSFSLLVGYIFLAVVPKVHLYRWLGGREKDREKLHRHFARFYRFYVFHLVPWLKPEVRNAYQEDFSKPALLIANHQSLLDLAGTLMLYDKIIVVVGGWVWNSPIYGHVMRFAEFLPASMPIEEMTSRVESCMKRGYSVLIFPEGTRSEDCHVQTFRRGAFHIAEKLKCDIVPITLWGTGLRLPKRDFCITPGRAVFEIGKRVSFADGIMGETHGELTRYWHKWFVKSYAELDAEMTNSK